MSTVAGIMHFNGDYICAGCLRRFVNYSYWLRIWNKANDEAHYYCRDCQDNIRRTIECRETPTTKEQR